MSKSKLFKILGFITILLILAAGLVSCGQKKATGSESTVVIVIPEDPPSFNAIVGDTGYDAMVMHMTMLGLSAIDPSGIVYPQLASELPTVENGGVVVDEENWSMDVTWKLRKDVTWADGTPVTSEDVLFTYKAITNQETGAWIDGIDYVDGVEKIDTNTFVVHYNSIYPGYQTFLGGERVVIWPSHYCKAEQGFMAWDCGRQPLSDGPFILQDWVSGDHMTFVRNPTYYETGKPGIDKVIVQIIPDDSVRKTMMIQGDADVLMWTTEQIADDLKNASNVKLSISDTNRWVMRLFFNLAARGSIDPVADPNPYFADVRVRQAIRMAIDVDTISNNVWHGYSKPVWTEFYRPPYACDIPKPVFDPEASKVLLEKAGWIDQDGDGTRECHGCQYAKEGDLLTFELITYSEYGEPLELTQQLISEMLGSIGMKVEMSIVQGSLMWTDSASGGIEQTGNFDLDLYDDGYAGTDPTDHIWFYYDSASAEPDNGWNVGRYFNPELDALIEQSYTLDEATRKELFCQMAKILDRDLPQILLFTTINADAYSTRLAGVQANINSVVTWNIADWTLVK
jgi:peptide/nickel transport system substrate-binding protein